MMTVDNLPEYTRYRDEGCEAAPSCLNCPFPHCLEDSPRARQTAATTVLARDITTLRRQGMTTAEIARVCGKSLRTVQRLLKQGREENPECHSEEASAAEESGAGVYPAQPPDPSHSLGMTYGECVRNDTRKRYI